MTQWAGSGRVRRQVALWWPAYVVVAAAAALRLSVLFSTPLVPQTDGAYYIAQVRSLLAGEGLRFSDTPLLFWLQAAASRLIVWATSLDERSGIILGVKLVDALIPVLAALPVFALWLRWTGPKRRSWLVGVTVAALPALSYGLVKMTGDLQKNSFALVLFALAIWAFDTAARRRSVGAWVLVAATLTAIAVSHVGVFAASMVFFVPAVLHLLSGGLTDSALRRRRLSLLALAAACASVAFYVAAQAVPKFSALATRLASPLALFAGENVFTRLAGRLNPSAGADVTAVLLAYAAVVAAVVLWRRHAPEPPTSSTLLGAIFATALLGFPLLGGIDGLRLHLMAYLPAAVVFAWIVGGVSRRWAVGLSAAVLIVNILVTMPTVPQSTAPTIAGQSYQELLALSPVVGDSEGTVVVARHGLEWWAAWAFDADVVPTIGATNDLWERYDKVLLLQEVKVQATSSGPPKRGTKAATMYVAGGGVVEGSTVIREGEWYRLSQTPSPVALGEEFEGEQRSGAAPRPSSK